MNLVALKKRKGRAGRVGHWTSKFISAGIWSGVFQITSKLSLLGATAVAARTLSHPRFGVFVALQGVAVVAAAVMDFGTSTMVGRELAAGQLTTRLFRRALRLRVWLVAPLGLLAVAGAAITLPSGHLLEVSFFIVAAIAINASMLLVAVLEGALNYRAAAICQSSGRLLFLVLTLLGGVLDHGSAATLAAAFAGGETTILAIGAFAVARAGKVTGLPSVGSADGQWVRVSLSYWLNSVFNLTYNRADIAIVALLAGSVQASLYGPASTIQNALLVVPGLAIAGLPNVGAAIYERGIGRERLYRTFRLTLAVAVGLGLGTATVATIVAPHLVELIGGATYHGAYVPTILLAWSTPFYAAQLALIALLVAMGRGPATTAIYGTALVSALLAHILLTPHFGAIGGAWASLLREPPALLVAWLVTKRAVRASSSSKAAVKCL